MIHIMVDIETLGHEPHNGVIMAIGAVAFTLETTLKYPTDEQFKNALTLEHFYTPIEVLPQEVMYDFAIDPDTLRWWMDTSRVNQFAEFMSSKQRQLLETACTLFKHWIEETGSIQDRRLWSHGVTFDCMHLAQKWPIVMNETFNRVCLYKNMRDTRTLFEIYGTKFGVFDTTERRRHHHPLEDAWIQAISTQTALKALQ